MKLTLLSVSGQAKAALKLTRVSMAGSRGRLSGSVAWGRQSQKHRGPSQIFQAPTRHQESLPVPAPAGGAEFPRSCCSSGNGLSPFTDGLAWLPGLPLHSKSSSIASCLGNVDPRSPRLGASELLRRLVPGAGCQGPQYGDGKSLLKPRCLKQNPPGSTHWDFLIKNTVLP